MEYKDMLKEGIASLPDSVLSKARFEIPKAVGHIQGNRTIISNFRQIADIFGREQEHLLKFLQKELATPGEIKPKGLILGTKVSSSMVNAKLRDYAARYVLCPHCGKPDTKLETKDRVQVLRCTACGAETKTA